MPNEKLVKLLTTFRNHDLVKMLKESNINDWRLLLVQSIPSEYSAQVPLSVDFIIIIDSLNVDNKKIDEAKIKLVSLLNNIDSFFYTYAIHTPTSFKDYLLTSRLSNENEINQFLTKSGSLETIFIKLQGADKKKLIDSGDNEKGKAITTLHAESLPIPPKAHH